MRIRELLWDDWNETHIARHSVAPEEAEDVCFSPRTLCVRVRRGRFRLIGQTEAGRYLMVIVESVGEDEHYVITAREATEPERRRLTRWRGT